MEFTNEIFFNKNLIANETIILKYCGKLYREHSKEITLVYGFGDNWENTSETQMKEIENGFEVSVELKDYNTFNFCFKNNYNIWDNNFGFNYIAPISHKIEGATDNQETQNTNESLDYGSVLEEAQDDTLENEDANSESENEENTSKIEIDSEIENVFSSLLDSILDVKPFENLEKIDFDNGFGLQSVSEIKEEDFISCDDIFNEFYNEISTEEVPEHAEITDYTLEELFNKIFADPASTQYEEQDLTEDVPYEVGEENTEELDGLVDNLLSSIANSSQININDSTSSNDESNNQLIEEENAEQVNEESSIANDVVPENSELPVIVKQGDLYDRFIDASYNFIKKIGIACKKVGTLIKIKAQEYGIIKK